MPRIAAFALTWSRIHNAYELFDNRKNGRLELELESSSWFAWLKEVPSFAFHGKAGSYTARKEQTQRGDRYWYAYVRVGVKVNKKYLGKTPELTLARLEQVATHLSARRTYDEQEEQRAGNTTIDDVVPLQTPARTQMVNSYPALLLSTKLHIPRPPARLVKRDRLHDVLAHALEYRLILLAAPAGCGKTTLLSSCLQHLSAAIAWVSLDDGDNDPVHFWSYMLAALDSIHPGMNTLAQGALYSSQPMTREVLLTAIINALMTCSQEIVLVLDDYHLITTRAIHTEIAFLLDHLPSHVHLIIATRVDPPLPLASLRSHGHLLELRGAQLYFTPQEAATFLTQEVGTHLSRDILELLTVRTEGWIAGLQLAALSLRGSVDSDRFVKTFTGGHRYIVDYLVQDVLAHQPASVQTFLLQTSILKRLHGSLCDVLTQKQDGQAMLDYLEQSNLFLIPLDDERQWYRYHYLFADVLRQRLERLHPDLLSTLHQRASAWYEQRGHFYEAVAHALAAEDFAKSAALIQQVGMAMVQRGEGVTVNRWLEKLPLDVCTSHIRLCLFKCWSLISIGQYKVAEQLLLDYEGLQVLNDHDSYPMPLPSREPVGSVSMCGTEQDDLSICVGEMIAMRSMLTLKLKGQIPEAIELANQALHYFPQESLGRSMILYHRGAIAMMTGDIPLALSSFDAAFSCSQAASSPFSATISAQLLVNLYIRQGCLHQAEQTCRRLLQLAMTEGGSPWVTGPIYLALADLYREWNRLDAAEHFLQCGITNCQTVNHVSALAFGLNTLARLKLARGDRSGAYCIMQEIETLVEPGPALFPGLSFSTINALQAWLAVLLDDLQAATHWLQAVKPAVDDQLHYLHEIEYLALARVLIAQGRLKDAFALLERLRLLAEQQQRKGSLIEIFVLLTQAYQAQKLTSLALHTLTYALELAEPEGYVRTFIDETPSMFPLLQKLREQWKFASQERVAYQAQAYVERLLLCGGSHNIEALAAKQAGGEELPDPLSERELEVLRLVVAGHSNREIASQLVVAVSTVKSHINTIYSKLQVESRTQAIARVRDLNLLTR